MQKLDKLNKQFLAQHVHAANNSLKNVERVIVFADAKLSLWQCGEFIAELENVASAAKDSHYNLLKQIAHITVLIVTLLQGELDEAILSPDLDQQLSHVLEEVTVIRENIAELLPAEDVQWQELILSESENFLRTLIVDTNVNRKELLKEYIEKTKPGLDYNAKTATHVQLHSLHQIMNDWKNKYHIDLEKTRILLVGVHGPRKDLIEAQYFMSLYNPDEKSVEDDKVFYVEMLGSQLATVDIKRDSIEGFLANCELNKSIGQHIFANKNAMFKDVLHEHAPKEIATLQRKNGCPVMHN